MKTLDQFINDTNLNEAKDNLSNTLKLSDSALKKYKTLENKIAAVFLNEVKKANLSIDAMLPQKNWV